MLRGLYMNDGRAGIFCKGKKYFSDDEKVGSVRTSVTACGKVRN